MLEVRTRAAPIRAAILRFEIMNESILPCHAMGYLLTRYVLSQSVRPSVCLSVCQVLVLCRNG